MTAPFTNMKMSLRDFGKDDTESVVLLWQKCGLTRPWNDPYKDILRKTVSKNGAFWVGIIDRKIMASVMIGYDGHRGSINYLAIDPDYAAEGLGRYIMEKAEIYLTTLDCPKVAFCVRRENDAVLNFYDKLGYEVDDVFALGKRLIPDD